jgi:hypothetical protein
MLKLTSGTYRIIPTPAFALVSRVVADAIVRPVAEVREVLDPLEFGADRRNDIRWLTREPTVRHDGARPVGRSFSGGLVVWAAERATAAELMHRATYGCLRDGYRPCASRTRAEVGRPAPQAVAHWRDSTNFRVLSNMLRQHAARSGSNANQTRCYHRSSDTYFGVSTRFTKVINQSGGLWSSNCPVGQCDRL